MHDKPYDYQQWQLEFENRKHKTNGYLIHIPLGLGKRLYYFCTVYMYISVRVYVLYCTYVIMYITNCTELAYIENLSLNDKLMYGIVHIIVIVIYAINVLSRYGNNPGPRHIEFLKHLIEYCKHSKLDTLKFRTLDGPTDMVIMTQLLQLRFQCDTADLGGNQDSRHSQTSYIGYFGQSIICWCSTD